MGIWAFLPPHLLYYNRKRSTSQDSNNFYRSIPSPPLGVPQKLVYNLSLCLFF
eukprot:GAHX01005385.1.p1 GENE.GAHX01005385.1~~GAHX01005385.1.p1  ORF type:complete len:53 (+),score=1.35 GAHX01005385.1:49-207(+)